MDWQASSAPGAPLPFDINLPVAIDPLIEKRMGLLSGDPSFRFRDLAQFQMFYIMRNRLAHSVRVGPTSCGKTKPLELSLLDLLPMFPDIKAVLIEPYDSIAQEMFIRFQKAGIPTALWKVAHRHYVPDETLLIVPIELVNSPALQQYLATASRNNRLAWVAFDEVNSVPEDQDFRPALVEAYRAIHLLNTVVTSMTATLAPKTESSLLDFLDLPQIIRPCVQFIRSPTYRSNVEFDVVTFSNNSGRSRSREHFIIMAAALVIDTMENALPNHHAIVFSTSRTDSFLWGKILNCGVINGVVVGEDRRQVYERWYKASDPLDRIISVNKAGYYGTNNPNAHYAFQLRMPRTLTDFAQSSGRVGRDGLPGAKSITVLSELPSPVQPESLESDSPSGELHIQHVMSGSRKRCIPQGLGKFLDGPSAFDCTAIKQKHPSYEECTACRPEGKVRPDYSEYIPLVDPNSSTLGSDIRNIVRCGGPALYLAGLQNAGFLSSTPHQHPQPPSPPPLTLNSSALLPHMDELVSHHTSRSSRRRTLGTVLVPSSQNSSRSRSGTSPSPSFTPIVGAARHHPYNRPEASMPPVGVAARQVTLAVNAGLRSTNQVLTRVKEIITSFPITCRYPVVEACYLCWEDQTELVWRSHNTIFCPSFKVWFESQDNRQSYFAWIRPFKFNEPGASAMHASCGLDMGDSHYHTKVIVLGGKEEIRCLYGDVVHPILAILSFRPDLRDRMWVDLDIDAVVFPNTPQGLIVWANQSVGRQVGQNKSTWMLLWYFVRGGKNPFQLT